LPIPERRDEFVFGRAADVMQMMGALPGKVVMFDRPAAEQNAPVAPENDELAAAIQAGKKMQSGGTPATSSH
jgi:hypothetical protein